MIAAAVVFALLVGAVGVQASHLFSDTAGHSSLEQRIAGDGSAGYENTTLGPGETPHVVRDAAENPAFPNAQAGRGNRRESLTYFGQLTDFQLADEESPARVEFLDPEPSGFAASAWRPQEALQPFIIDWSIRQMNLFAPASPVAQGDGTKASMDFALVTGDQADNQQRNETLWTRALLEGAQTNYNSGSTNPDDYDAVAHPSCLNYPPTAEHLEEALRYTGVQDYDDYDEGANPYFYDPDDVRGAWAAAGWPSYPGLMDRAQQLELQAVGLDVPSYVTNGNHDGLVQGNEDANAAFEDISTGCFKATASSTPPTGGLNPSALLTPSAGFFVPPDEGRRFVDKRQVKAIYKENNRDNGHGYDFVDPVENTAANGGAGYYAWDPPRAPGFRFISIDTLSEGGIVDQSSNGNIDDPQFQWLKRELDAATARDQLVVMFGHHPVRSLTSEAADEAAGPCVGPDDDHGDTPEHNHEPGCDIDPRDSEPVHLGVDPSGGDPRESLVELLDRYPHLIAYVAGHTHENRVTPFTRSQAGDGGVWWGIETSATADWPVQHRVMEVMDNQDGTLSIFGTVLDHAASSQAPPPGPAQSFDAAMLASVGREMAFNDPQAGEGAGDGSPQDRNVELLVYDPRRSAAGYPRPKAATPLYAPLVVSYKPCAAANRVHAPPLNYQSCAPPQQESAFLTVGTPDANGQQAKAVGFVRARVINGNPATSADEADLALSASMSDVRTKPSLAPYGGSLRAKVSLRITDRLNGPGPTGGTDAGTGDAELTFVIPCVGVANPTDGSTCAIDTSADAIVPGMAPEGARSIWEMGQIAVQDGGADGNGATTGDNTGFLRQGLFVP